MTVKTLKHFLGCILLLSLYAMAKAQRPSDGCGTPLGHGIHPGHSFTASIRVNDPGMGEVTRTFRVHVPKHYKVDVPIAMVADYHGWTGDAHSQERDSHFSEVADRDPVGFMVVTPNGMGDNPEGGNWGSFNCSSTNGPLGPPCDTDRSRWGAISCYSSCPNCDPNSSCDWTSCHDDIAFTRAMIEYVSNNFCVDLNSIHQSGISNGGMFSYYMASRMSDIFASIGPVAGAPLIGFGDLPKTPMSVIDFHGIEDDTIPYDLAHAEGMGPHKSVISWDGYFYEQKQQTISKWVEGMNCETGPEPWPTPMDGVQGWSCTVWSRCRQGVEIVSCTGHYSHDYPFGGWQYVDGTQILWDFMKSHPRR